MGSLPSAPETTLISSAVKVRAGRENTDLEGRSLFKANLLDLGKHLASDGRSVIGERQRQEREASVSDVSSRTRRHLKTPVDRALNAFLQSRHANDHAVFGQALELRGNGDVHRSAHDRQTALIGYLAGALWADGAVSASLSAKPVSPIADGQPLVPVTTPDPLTFRWRIGVNDWSAAVPGGC